MRHRYTAILSLSVCILLSGHARGEEQLDCADCHDTEAAAFPETVHGFLDCSDCHGVIDDVPHPEGTGEVACADCHQEILDELTLSAHGQARASGSAEAPGCDSCHGSLHGLVPTSDPGSMTHPSRLPDTCGDCHSDPQLVAKYGIPVAFPIEAYRSSVHAVAANEGAATCTSCHGSHRILSAADPDSTVNHQKVAGTCGTCHDDIAQLYNNSVHGKAAAHGAREAPVCTDCHGEHRILSPREEASPVYASNIPKMTCGRCHGDLRLVEKYGISADKVPAYEDSYHGLASRAGALTVAHCGSCHGVHDILPSSDSESHVHPDNLVATCGSCHPGVGEKVALGSVHVLKTDKSRAGVYWVRVTYLWLIYLTIGGMLVHNFLDLRSKVRNPLATLRLRGAGASGPERMSRGFRATHALLMVTFVVLVYTGFTLTYPEHWWARPLLRWEESLGLRGWLHRVAAVLMVLDVVFHAIHLAVDRAARRCIRQMWPGIHDWREFVGRMAFYVGRRKEPPAAPWLGYPEKLEYLALMWGTLVMAVTGFMLWFDNFMMHWFPKWVIDVATTIHFYEAVLASLAILVWHMYYVIFDPVVYPMDTAWLKGRSAPGRDQERQNP